MQINTKTIFIPKQTFENGPATSNSTLETLRRQAFNTLLWEDTFYQSGSQIAKELSALVRKSKASWVYEVAVECGTQFHLRHTPLYLLVELAKRQVEGDGPAVRAGLEQVIQRPDQLTETLALYWQGQKGREKTPIPNSIKKALRTSILRFTPYQLAKYNRPKDIKLKDILRLVHPKPQSLQQAQLFKSIIDDTLESPDTWEVALSSGQDKLSTFTRLLEEGKLGGLACLRNLRNMREAGVSKELVHQRLQKGLSKVFPYQFLTAARYNPIWEDMIEESMFQALEGFPTLPGRTGLLVDVSGSMNFQLSSKGETTRMDAASGLGVLLKELADHLLVATFSFKTVEVPSCRGFALRDAIQKSQPHNTTFLGAALKTLQAKPEWQQLDRLIIITDEQTQDRIPSAWVDRSYIINVAPYQNGVGYQNGYIHVNGWSERVFNWIQLYESKFKGI